MYELNQLQTSSVGDAKLRQEFCRLTVRSNPRSMLDVTPALREWLAKIAAKDGMLTIFLRHTSASLTITENTDPDVQSDILDALDELAPRNRPWLHSMEGSDDMPSHIKSALMGVSHSIPVLGGELELGTWQAIYLVEHRDQSHRRTATLHYLGG